MAFQYGVPEFAARQQALEKQSVADQAAIERRRRIAEAMMSRSAQPIETSEFGGIPVPIHPLQGVSKLLEAYLGRRGATETEKMESGASAKRAEEEAKILSDYQSGQQSEMDRFQKGILPTPASPMPAPELGGGPYRPEIPKSDSEKLAIIQEAQMSDYPKSQKFGYFQQTQMDKADAARAAAEAKKEADAQRYRDQLERDKILAAMKGQQQKEPIQLTDAAGNVKLVDYQGNVIKELGAVGKPTATHEKTAAAKSKLKTDLGTAINELEKATKDGGLIDKATGSGAGALADIAAGFVGHATEGSIAIGQLQPIYDLVLKMVPRFEGPQSDRDTASYREAAGELANPNVPNARKKAAGKEILRLMKEREGQFISKELEGSEIDRPVSPASGGKDSGWSDL